MSCLVLVVPGGADYMMAYWVSTNRTKKRVFKAANLDIKKYLKMTVIRIGVVFVRLLGVLVDGVSFDRLDALSDVAIPAYESHSSTINSQEMWQKFGDQGSERGDLEPVQNIRIILFTVSSPTI
jgi:hypothetical protein